MDTTLERSPAPGGPVERTRPAPRPWLPLVVWAAVILLARQVVLELKADGAHLLRIPYPPLDASLEWRPGWPLLWSIAVGIVAVAVAPRLAQTLAWRTLLVGSAVLAGAWAVALALLDGAHGLVASVSLKNEYFLDIGRVGAPLEFLAGFTEHIADYRIHVRGHPPGFLLILWVMDRIGLGSVSAVAALEIVGGVLAVPAVLLAVREVVGERAARSAAPFVAVAPVAIWVATSADAFYAGVGAWAVTLVVLATGRVGRRGTVCAVAGGVLFGVVAFLSYGLVLLAVVPTAVAWSRRRVRVLVVAAGAALVVFALFASAGFWWFAGLAATREQYFAGVASRRPYAEFLLVNLACLAIILGPALAVALVRLRDRRMWLLVGAALVAVAIAGVSGMSKGEVERIWLPFAMWVLPAAAVHAGRRRAAGWLGLQVAFTIGLQTLVRSPW